VKSLNNKIHNAFSQIKASDDLKKDTDSFLSQEIRNRNKRTKHKIRYSFATVLAVFMMFSGIGGYSVWATPMSYISVDVNPSVELTLNRFDRVISASAYNEDGQFVLDEVSLKGKTYTNAIDALVDSERMSRYLTEDVMLSFTVVSDKKEKLIAGISNCNGYKQYRATSGSVDYSVMKEAHENRVSFGKYKIYLLLSEYDQTNAFEYYRNFTMRELHDMLQAHGNYEIDGNWQDGNKGHQNGK
jgi:hypothetical protein